MPWDVPSLHIALRIDHHDRIGIGAVGWLALQMSDHSWIFLWFLVMQ